MKRIPMIVLAVLAVALLLASALAGCGTDEPEAAPEPTGTPEPAAPVGPPPEGYDPMPTSGPGETAALAALPGFWTTGVVLPDVTGIDPVFTAYLIRVDMDGQTALFEVHADGVAQNAYAGNSPFDSGRILWYSAEEADWPSAAPRSAGEENAVQAVRYAMADAFEETPFQAAIHAYRFSYLVDGYPKLSIDVGVDGGLRGVDYHE